MKSGLRRRHDRGLGPDQGAVRPLKSRGPGLRNWRCPARCTLARGEQFAQGHLETRMVAASEATPVQGLAPDVGERRLPRPAPHGASRNSFVNITSE